MRVLVRSRPACAWVRCCVHPRAGAGGPRRSCGSSGGRPSGTGHGDALRTLSRVQQKLERESDPEAADIEIAASHQARALGITALHSAAWAGGGAAFAAALLHLPVDSNFLGFAASHPEWSTPWVGAHAAYFGLVGLRRGMIHGAESILLRSAWLRQVVDGIGDLHGFSVSSVHEWVAFRVLFEERLERWTEAVRREGGLAEYFPPVSVTIDRCVPEAHRTGAGGALAGAAHA